MDASRTIIELQVRHIADDFKNAEGDLLAMLARWRGWNPLVRGESMTVSFSNGRQYEVKRIDKEPDHE